jgi:hypothetical protein
MVVCRVVLRCMDGMLSLMVASIMDGTSFALRTARRSFPKRGVSIQKSKMDIGTTDTQRQPN